MKRIIVQQWLTIDGYAEDKNGRLDFFPDHESEKYSDREQLEFLESVDMILLGRKTYELFVDFWPTATIDKEIIADKLNSLPKFVFSNTLTSAPWGKWPDASVVKGQAVDEISKLKQGNGKDMVLWGSISLTQQLIKANLVDELHLRVCPTMSGGGRSLFPDLSAYLNFQLAFSKSYESGVVLMHYKPKP